jgi:hypothetical protein
LQGDQLGKTYSSSKKGTVVFVTSPPINLSGQVIQISEPGLYYFDGNLWQTFSKKSNPLNIENSIDI